MRTEEASPTIPATKNLSLSTRSHWRWLRFLRSPLWLCLLLALLIRAWLVVHTQGVIAGDEAMVGLQAENILRGQHPVYYYGQPYMGSLEAYFAALLFASGHALLIRAGVRSPGHYALESLSHSFRSRSCYPIVRLRLLLGWQRRG